MFRQTHGRAEARYRAGRAWRTSNLLQGQGEFGGRTLCMGKEPDHVIQEIGPGDLPDDGWQGVFDPVQPHDSNSRFESDQVDHVFRMGMGEEDPDDMARSPVGVPDPHAFVSVAEIRDNGQGKVGQPEHSGEFGSTLRVADGNVGEDTKNTLGQKIIFAEKGNQQNATCSSK